MRVQVDLECSVRSPLPRDSVAPALPPFSVRSVRKCMCVREEKSERERESVTPGERERERERERGGRPPPPPFCVRPALGFRGRSSGLRVSVAPALAPFSVRPARKCVCVCIHVCV